METIKERVFTVKLSAYKDELASWDIGYIHGWFDSRHICISQVADEPVPTFRVLYRKDDDDVEYAIERFIVENSDYEINFIK